jgi:hypothetical protein
MSHSDAGYSKEGALVCRDCALAAAARANLEEAAHQKAVRGGLLDRLFLQHLTPRGRLAYWVGQIVVLPFIFCAWFQANGRPSLHRALSASRKDELAALMVAMLGAIMVWGVVCVVAWRRKPSVG